MSASSGREANVDVIECSLQFPDDDYSWWDLFMKICVFVFAFVIPVLIIIICYTLMILRLKSVRLLSGSREKDRNLRRITRLVLVVVAVFIICWTPIHIFILVEALGNASHSTAALSSYYFCIALGYTNSSLNPILYAFLDENFKRKFVFSHMRAEEASLAEQRAGGRHSSGEVLGMVMAKGMKNMRRKG
ncbi:hypothetical protein GH733_007831 [Mirounga leonina]|nr:hypothetical protein GH733_007831 [Mirounga leonina]